MVCKSESATDVVWKFSLEEGDKTKKRKKKVVANDKSVDYNLDSYGDGEEDDYEVATRAKLLQKKHCLAARDLHLSQKTCTQLVQKVLPGFVRKWKKIRYYNPPEHESAPADPFLPVINKECDGHRRLFGRDVTNTLIKNVNGDGSASTLPGEIVKSPTVSLKVEKGQSFDMLRDLEANYERRISQLKEDHARQLEAMQQKNDDDCEKLIEDVVRKILEKLPLEVVRGFLT
ncbi:hypothetical protein Tco_0845305 [Tanacetum coccineum]